MISDAFGNRDCATLCRRQLGGFPGGLAVLPGFLNRPSHAFLARGKLADHP